MKNFLRLAGWLSFGCAQLFAAVPASTVFVDATVISMESNRPLPHHTVVVEGDRIVWVGPNASAAIPAGAQRVDAAGKFLIPGLGEMHGHNPPPGSSREFIEQVYFLFVANGVTTVRGMLGWPGQLELREQVKAGEVLGPALYLAGGPSFTGGGANAVQSPAQAEARVRQQKAEGWDLLKVHPGLSLEVFDAMAKTADEVGIRFAGHVPAAVGLRHAIARRQQTIDHLDGYIEELKAEATPVDRAQLASLVRLTRETGTAVVPTMALWDIILGATPLADLVAMPELRFMPAQTVAAWKRTYEERLANPAFDAKRVRQTAENRRVVLKALGDGGATILFGTDAPQQFSVPGFSIHREMKAMADAGMKPFEILHSATRAVGEHLKAKDAFGTIARGQRADLVLLTADPLTDIGNVAKRAGVMLRGQWLPEPEIQARLEKIAAAGK